MSPIAQAATILSLSLLSLSQLSVAAPVLTHHLQPKRYNHQLPNAHKWDTYTALPTTTAAADWNSNDGSSWDNSGNSNNDGSWNDNTDSWAPAPTTTSTKYSAPTASASASNGNTGTDLSAAPPRPKTDKLRGVNLGGVSPSLLLCDPHGSSLGEISH